MTAEMLTFSLFVFLGAQIVVGTIGTVWAKSPVSSALFLVLNFFALGGLYLLLEAQFIAVVQVIVYAGAIMVLFLFTIMLLNLNDDRSLRQKFDLQKGLAVALSGALFFELAYILAYKVSYAPKQVEVDTAAMGDAKAIGKALLTEFLFPFEAISILLLLAVVGAILLAKRQVSSLEQKIPAK